MGADVILIMAGICLAPRQPSETPDTWAEKFESFERLNSIRVTNGNFDSCNSCKRLVSSRLHELHESKCPFVILMEFFCSKLSNFSAYESRVRDDYRWTAILLWLGDPGDVWRATWSSRWCLTCDVAMLVICDAWRGDAGDVWRVTWLLWWRVTCDVAVMVTCYVWRASSSRGFHFAVIALVTGNRAPLLLSGSAVVFFTPKANIVKGYWKFIFMQIANKCRLEVKL